MRGERPRPRVEVEAVQAGVVVVVGRAAEDVERGGGEGDHRVAVAAPGRQRRGPQDVLRADSRPRGALLGKGRNDS